MKKLIIVLVCLGVVAINNAFAADDQVVTIPPQQTAASNNIDPNSTAVTINGVDVKEALVQQLMGQMTQRLQNVPDEYKPMFLEQERQKALDRIIQKTLLDKEVEKAKIVIAEQDIDKYINETLSREGMSMDDLKAVIVAKTGKTFEQWKQQMAENPQFKYYVFFNKQFEGKVNVTPEDANAFYKANLQQFENPEQVKASHILIKVDENATENEKAEAKVKAEDLLKQLKEGADFAELAKANSGCPSSARGGDLGFFEQGKMVPEFSQAAFAMKVGQTSEVVKTQFGYHIIKVTDHKSAGTTPFAEAKDRIIAQLVNEKEQVLFNEYLEQLKKTATIVYPPGKEPKQITPPVKAETAPAEQGDAKPAEPNNTKPAEQSKATPAEPNNTNPVEQAK